MANNVIDFLSLLQGSRFAVTFFDYANRDKALPDELMIDKDGDGSIYYKKKTGEIIKIFGNDEGSISQEDLLAIENKIAQVLQSSKTYTNEQIRGTKEYADQLFSNAVGSNTFKLVHYQYTITVEQDDTYSVQIPLSTYTPDDAVLITTNAVVPSPADSKLGYTISDTGLVTFTTPFNTGSVIYMIVFKNVPVGPEGSFSGSLISNKSIGLDKLSDSVTSMIKEGANVEIPVSTTQPDDQANGSMWFQVIQ